jgi:hypothetical protein
MKEGIRRKAYEGGIDGGREEGRKKGRKMTAGRKEDEGRKEERKQMKEGRKTSCVIDFIRHRLQTSDP